MAVKASAFYRDLIVALVILSCTVLTSAQPSPVRAPTHDRYTGDQKCLSCHKEKDSYLRTAHHLTSRSPTRESVLAHFSAGANVLKTSNPDLIYHMDATSDGFYETAVQGPPEDPVVRRERIDLVIGSGRKGQTYLFWRGNRLFELPVSYWTELDNWVSSPGYREDLAEFSRPVPGRCLECHAGYFEAQPASPSPNAYNKANFVLGISCERCHGPGQEHARKHEPRPQKPADEQKPVDEAIVNPAKLARKRQIDVCAVCHAGIGAMPLSPAFSYFPGALLEDYIVLEHPRPDAAIDVHGNQVALLERSRCFESSHMTCSTCHNVHTTQRDAASFSQHCLACHKAENCGMHEKLGAKIADNCVDCHMPPQSSNAIVSDASGRKVRPLVRSHWIKVYPGSIP